METVKHFINSSGKLYFPICDLPEPVANAWIDYLGEERKSSEPIPTCKWSVIDGEITSLHIVFIEDEYHLITEPSTED